MQERLQKILSRAGISSRRAAEDMIVAGRVAVNGFIVKELGAKADPDKDTITVDGRALTVDAARVYLVLYKPAGYMTTLKDPQGRPLVTTLLGGIRERVYPVGRLDYNTEGLLLLTNDGEWANALAHPRHEVDKEYHVRVRGKVSQEQVDRLSAGVTLDDGPTAAARVSIVRESDNNTWLSITIHEGRYRQVRRMCEAVGLAVVRLKRVRYGFLGLDGLKPGKYRFLTPGEVARLREPRRGGTSGVSSVSAEQRREQRPRGIGGEQVKRNEDKKRRPAASGPGKGRGGRRQS